MEKFENLINKEHALLKKKEIESQYNIVNGIIQNPGRFENEPITTVFYYELLQNSGDIYEGSLIEIEPTDRLVFDIPDDKEYARIVEDDMGFITVEFVNIPHSYYGWDD